MSVSDAAELEALEGVQSALEESAHEVDSTSESSREDVGSTSESSREEGQDNKPKGFGWEEGDIYVEVENLSSFNIAELMIVHKHLGMETPTTVMEWKHLKSGAKSDIRKFRTIVGLTALRNDYWRATWTFEKQAKAMGCFPCEKANGTCATWLSESENTLITTALDLNTYVKAGVTALGFVVSAASGGTATSVAVALGGMVTESVASALLDEENVDGFTICGMKNSILQRSRTGRPLKIVIQPPRRSKEGLIAEVLMKRKEGDCMLDVSPMKCETEETGEDVDIRIKAAVDVRTAALLHRYRGFTPSLDILHWSNLAANQLSKAKATSTTTGMMKLYNDMWWLWWIEEGSECVVKSTSPGNFVQLLESAPERAAHGAATALGTAVGGKHVKTIAKFTKHAKSHHVYDPLSTLYKFSPEVKKIIGRGRLLHLAGTEDEEGFKKCNLGAGDLKAHGPVHVLLPRKKGADFVIFQWHGKICKVGVEKSCQPTKKCQRDPICKGLPLRD